MISFPVHKLLTFKSGKFYFSTKVTSEEINTLLLENKILYQTINDLPILPSIASQIQEDLIMRSIFSTAAIEGNPLSEEKVAAIVNNPNQEESKNIAEREIENLINVYADLKRRKPSTTFFVIDETDVIAIQKAITNGTAHNDNIPGNYRNSAVKVGDKLHGGIYTPPKILKDIRTLMSTFFEWINHENMSIVDPIIRAALSHLHLGLIHPFADGNGRTARLVEALILQTAGIKYVPLMLSNYYYRNVDEYYWAYSKTIKNKENDVTDFLKFYLIGLKESLNEIKDIITLQIVILTLKEYYLSLYSEKIISQRQFDFLLVLTKNTRAEFSLKELSVEQPFNLLFRNISPLTVRRDINKLLKLNLIEKVNNSHYTINLKILNSSF